jgi:hypothetical protein
MYFRVLLLNSSYAISVLLNNQNVYFPHYLLIYSLTYRVHIELQNYDITKLPF